MNTSKRAYARAIDRGDYALARRIDDELDRAFYAANPGVREASSARSEAAYNEQQRAACPIEGEPMGGHDPREQL